MWFNSLKVMVGCVALSNIAWSQEYKVVGKVVDDQSNSISYVDVEIFNTNFNPILATITNDEGSYEIDLTAGKYIGVFSFWGYKPDTLNFEVINKSLEIGIVKLRSEVEQLDVVKFSDTKSAMEYKIDKRVYNVASDLNNQGVSASEMLENIPSITVDAEGNVSLRGNQSVRILIDGKYSGFASSGDALKTLQADKIEKVEIVTNASARYDAQGDAGIINIILKKNKNIGVSGSANARLGYLPEIGASVQLNYKKNKLNSYVNLNVNKDQAIANSTTYQKVNSADTNFTYKQLYNHDRRKLRTDATLGFDYDLSSKSTLSLNTNARLGDGNHVYKRIYKNFDGLDNVLSEDNRMEYNTEKETLLEATLGYKYKFNKDGSTWTTDVKLFRDKDLEQSDYDEYNNMQGSNKIEKSKVDVREQYLLAQSDLVYGIGANGKMEAGIRMQSKTISNAFRYEAKHINDWVPIVGYNDDFEYDEHVYAAYITGSNTFQKLGVQLGLRGELSQMKTFQHSEGVHNTKKFMDFFPSAAFSYKLSESTTFQLSYSKRIHRPGQWDLMPFMKFGDNRERFVGNADITPEYTHAIEFGGMQYVNNGSILASAYYKKTVDKIDRMSIIGDDGIVYRVAMNVSERDAIGLELNGNYNCTNWLKLSSGFNFYKEIVRGEFEDYTFDVENFSWTNRTSLNFLLPKQFKVQLSSNYQAPSIKPQGKTLAITYGDIAISKDVLKNKGTVAVNVRDVFNSRRHKSETNTSDIYALTDYQWRPRSIKLVFTYRFNQSGKINNPKLNNIQYDGDMG